MTKLIIFDFWGTLVDNAIKPSPIKQVRFILRNHEPFGDYVVKFEKAFMTKEFDSLKTAFEEVCDEFNIPKKDFILDKLIGLWNKKSILSRPFEETMEVLEDLKKDYKIVLLSNSDNFSYNQVMEKFDLDKYFDKKYMSFETGVLKTDPEIFAKILSDFDVSNEDAVMVGDGMYSDIKAAENANVKGVLVDRNDTREYENKIVSLKELRGLLENG